MERSIDDETAAELRELAEQLRQAERIRDRTAQHITESMARTMPATTGMAVHPESLQQAAKSIIEEEATRDAAEAALEALGERPLATPRTRVEGPAHEKESRPLPVSLVLLLIFVLAAVAAAALEAPIAIPIALAAAGVVLAVVVWAIRRRRRPAPMATPSAEDDPDPEATWLAERSKLEVDRDRALERLRSARRQWEALAGPNADPRNIEAVLRLNDPQFRLVSLADDTSPTVRTANALHRRVLARWKVRWAALGYDDPPSPNELEEELARLRH